MTKKERRFESGYCTGSGCGTFVRSGDAVQVVGKKGELDRLCWRCTKKIFVS